MSSPPSSVFLQQSHSYLRQLQASNNDDQQEDGNSTVGANILFCLFGAFILCIMCSLSRSYQRQMERDEQERLEQEQMQQEKQIQEAIQRRKNLIQSFMEHDLCRKLEPGDIVPVTGDQTASVGSGIEDLHPQTNTSEEKLVEYQPEDSNAIPSNNNEEQPQRNRTSTGSSQKVADTSVSPSSMEKSKEDDIEAQKTENSNSLSSQNDQRGLDSVRSDDGLPEPKTKIVLPPQDNDEAALVIAGQCVICLEAYETGETIVWSGNSECSHGFHQECILDYLAHHNAEAAPCPCCRQLFLPMK